MKIYLAAPYSWKDKIKEHRQELEDMGFEVTSRWLNERAQEGNQAFSDRFLKVHARIDKEDIRNSDILILFTTNESMPRGGRHHEAGYAEGLGKRVVICGPKENIFHYLPEIVHCLDFVEVKHYLEYLGVRYEV